MFLTKFFKVVFFGMSGISKYYAKIPFCSVLLRGQKKMEQNRLNKEMF